jgi:hypothetical protein
LPVSRFETARFTRSRTSPPPASCTDLPGLCKRLTRSRRHSGDRGCSGSHRPAPARLHAEPSHLEFRCTFATRFATVGPHGEMAAPSGALVELHLTPMGEEGRPTLTDPTSSPALRISHIVYGRRSDRGRVKYLVDPQGRGDEWAIPEQVVLRRWRRRRSPDYTFSGERLSSTIWRALPAMLGGQVQRWRLFDLSELERLHERCASDLRARKLSAPSASTIIALIQSCGTEKIEALVDRHRGLEQLHRSGVPDLFLFAQDATGRTKFSRFVEVKKPEEPLSQDQRDEVGFMRALGLHVRVLRLIERERR